MIESTSSLAIDIIDDNGDLIPSDYETALFMLLTDLVVEQDLDAAEVMIADIFARIRAGVN